MHNKYHVKQTLRVIAKGFFIWGKCDHKSDPQEQFVKLPFNNKNRPTIRKKSFCRRCLFSILIHFQGLCHEMNIILHLENQISTVKSSNFVKLLGQNIFFRTNFLRSPNNFFAVRLKVFPSSICLHLSSILRRWE